jgi:hypothetical protein
VPSLRTGVLAGLAAFLRAGVALASPGDMPVDAPSAVAAPAVSSQPSPASAVSGEHPATLAGSDHFSLGAFGGVGFPRPLSVGGMVRIERIAGFGLEYSLLPKLSISGFDTSFWALAGTARVFPFRGAFFLGIAGGRQHIGLSASTPLGDAAQVADTWFVNPQIGFLKTFRGGFTLGMDAGVQIPLTAAYSSNVPSVISSTSTVFDVAHTAGTSVLPTLDLFRLGLTI